MKSIKFSEKEIEFLREQYLEELANAEQYVEQVKEILKKLNISAKDEPVEKETKKDKKKDHKHKSEIKELKKRGRKPKGVEHKTDTIQIPEPKKRGRKPKVAEPATATVVSAKPLIPENNEPKKRGRKPKIVISNAEILPSSIAEPAKKEIKAKREPKPKKETISNAAVVVEKKPIVKPAVKPKPEPKLKKVITPKVKVEKKPVVKKVPKTKQIPKVKTIPTSLPTPLVKKEEKKLIKKTSPKGTVKLNKLEKPVSKRGLKVKPATKIVAAEPIITLEKETKE